MQLYFAVPDTATTHEGVLVLSLIHILHICYKSGDEVSQFLHFFQKST